MSDPEDDDYFDDAPEDEDFDLDECGMMTNGQCMLAGTEFCDWDCPREKLRRKTDRKQQPELPL